MENDTHMTAAHPQPITLKDAQDWLRDRIDEGERCPCCTQFAKIYKRRIHATMARELILMHHAVPADEWFHLPTVLSRGAHGGDITKLVYWELIEEDDQTREDGSTRAGWWRVTQKGRWFANGDTTIPRYARIYDGRLLGFTGEQVTIRDALGTKFDYTLLMQGAA